MAHIFEGLSAQEEARLRKLEADSIAPEHRARIHPMRDEDRTPTGKSAITLLPKTPPKSQR